MNNEPFEGEKSVRIMRNKNDEELFKIFVKKFGFKREIDLVTFCVAIALRKQHNYKTLDKKYLSSAKKLVGMETFDKRDLYDLVISEYLECRENRLKEFETYFYTGFNILKSWFEEFSANINYYIQRFSDMEYYIAKRE